MGNVMDRDILSRPRFRMPAFCCRWRGWWDVCLQEDHESMMRLTFFFLSCKVVLYRRGSVDGNAVVRIDARIVSLWGLRKP